MLEETHKAQTRRQAMIVWTYIEKKEAFDRSKNGFERNRNEESEAASQKKKLLRKRNQNRTYPTQLRRGGRRDSDDDDNEVGALPPSLSLFLSFFVGAGYLPVANTAFIDWFCRRLTRVSSTDTYLWSALAHEVAAAWPGFLHRTNAPATGKTPNGTGFNRLIYYT